MEEKFGTVVGENRTMIGKLRENERTIKYLEREVERRSKEYKEMVYAV
jgi:hypothetical protein